MAKAEIRMTEGPIAKQLVSFAIPLFLGFLFQQLYNTADALIVGNLLGNSALAAVTGTGTLIFLLVGFFGGISMGAGVVVSRFFGSREVEKMRAAIHTNIAFGMAAGVFLTVVGMLFTPQILQWMGTPEDVMPQSVAYIRTYFAGSIGLVMYNQCRGVMQAVGDSRHPLYYLIISSITNVVLDILLIAVFKMDVDGAALATIISQFVSVFLCMGRLMNPVSGECQVKWREVRFDPEMTRMILSYGLPSGLLWRDGHERLRRLCQGGGLRLPAHYQLYLGHYHLRRAEPGRGRAEAHPAGRAVRHSVLGHHRGGGWRAAVLAGPHSHQGLYPGAGGHRLWRAEDAHLLAVLLSAGAFALSGSGHARRRSCGHSHDFDAVILVRGACCHYYGCHPHLPKHCRCELGLPHYLGAQQHLPAYLLLQSRLADSPGPPQRRTG